MTSVDMVNELLKEHIENLLERIGIEVHFDPHGVKYYRNKMLQGISLEDGDLLQHDLEFLEELEGLLRSSRFRFTETAKAAERVYAFRLNIADRDDMELEKIQRITANEKYVKSVPWFSLLTEEPAYPEITPELDQKLKEIERDTRAIVFLDPTRIVCNKAFGSYKSMKFSDIEKSTKLQIGILLQELWSSTRKRDKDMIEYVRSLFERKEAMEKAESTERAVRNPKRIIYRTAGLTKILDFDDIKRFSETYARSILNYMINPSTVLEQEIVDELNKRLEVLRAGEKSGSSSQK